MEISEHIDTPAIADFVIRLRTKGFTAAGVERVLTSLLKHPPARNGNTSRVTLEGTMT